MCNFIVKVFKYLFGILYEIEKSYSGLVEKPKNWFWDKQARGGNSTLTPDQLKEIKKGI